MESTLCTSQGGGQKICSTFYPKRDLCIEKDLLRKIQFAPTSEKPLVAQKEHQFASRTSRLLIIWFIVLTIHFRYARADQGKGYNILLFACGWHSTSPKVCTTVNKLSYS